MPGAFDKSDQFVPDPAERAVPFRDYVYTPAATPIWNLPGYFREATPEGRAAGPPWRTPIPYPPEYLRSGVLNPVDKPKP